MFIRSKLEHSSVVWSSGLTQEESDDLEGIQKAAVKVMTGRHYEDYEKGLESPNMKTLVQRRQVLGLKFAKSCLKNDKVKNFFPNLQRVLNKDELLKKSMLRRIGC